MSYNLVSISFYDNSFYLQLPLNRINMLNSSEEIAYCYLRLNGFFVIDNFVIHKSTNIDYSSDGDLLAIRMPFVYEEIGGKPEDWDNKLFRSFDTNALLGVIVQVKGGEIKRKRNKELFEKKYLDYNIRRLGMTKIESSIDSILSQFESSPIATIRNELEQKCQIAKLLITKNIPRKRSKFLCHSLNDTYKFIEERINKYQIEKSRDKFFFSNLTFQTLIERKSLL